MSAKVRVSPELDADLHEWLAAEAARQHRSLNGQVSYILQRFRERAERARRGGVRILDAGDVVAATKFPEGFERRHREVSGL